VLQFAWCDADWSICNDLVCVVNTEGRFVVCHYDILHVITLSVIMMNGTMLIVGVPSVSLLNVDMLKVGAPKR